MEETKKCPYCGEEILAVAKKCKHCKKWLTDSEREIEPVDNNEPEIVDGEISDSIEVNETPVSAANQPVQGDLNKSSNKIVWIALAAFAVLLAIFVWRMTDGGEDLDKENEIAMQKIQSPSNQEESNTIDPITEQNIRSRIEEIFTATFGDSKKSEANYEARYFSSELYNTYFSAKEMADKHVDVGMNKNLWYLAKNWSKLEYKINKIKPTTSSFVIVDMDISNPQNKREFGNMDLSLYKDGEEWKIDDMLCDASLGWEKSRLINSIKAANGDSSSSVSSSDGIDYWSGRIRIDGCIHRLCDSRVFLELVKSGENYTGTIHLLLGFRDDMERITSENGELEGKVKAKDTEKGLLVSMISYDTTSGQDYDMFSGKDGVRFKEGEQIFLISRTNSGYATKALGKMERFFDGCTIETNK